MSPLMSPPINDLSPCTCLPHIMGGGGQIPPMCSWPIAVAENNGNEYLIIGALVHSEYSNIDINPLMAGGVDAGFSNFS